MRNGCAAVATDLRAGVVSRKLDVLREQGAVREHRTHDEARAALVRSWAEAARVGKSALLVASRNDDVRAMNELARVRLSASGSARSAFYPGTTLIENGSKRLCFLGFFGSEQRRG